MTIRTILLWPDKRLRTPAEEVTEITDEIKTLWADMVETMDFMPGVGLAAPQVGVLQQIAVVDASHERNKRILLANPQVIDASTETTTREEASPCLPGVSGKVTRPRAVTVRFMDQKGVIVRRDFEGMEATSVQHQIDHLAGRMYFDNLSKVKRDMSLRRSRKLKP